MSSIDYQLFGTVITIDSTTDMMCGGGCVTDDSDQSDGCYEDD